MPEWTAGLLTRALAAAAETAGRTPAELSESLTPRLGADAESLASVITTREGEERELVARMLAERARAAAAAVYADERAAATVAKVERHLGRELERALHLLVQLQAVRRDRDDLGGEVLGGVIELAEQRDAVVPALVEARGSGPPLWSAPAAEEARPG
jgi:hypothetical protein